MFIQYYKYYWQYPYHKGAKPQYRSWKSKTAGKGNINYGVIDWKLPANARIAIVGDIGTGTDVAAAVIEAACKFKPDAILHLGDIYFSGTKAETQKRLVGMVKKVLKKEKLNILFLPYRVTTNILQVAFPSLKCWMQVRSFIKNRSSKKQVISV